MYITIDLESDGLYYDVTKIHTIAIKIEDGATEVYTSSPIKGSKGSLSDAIEILKAHKNHTIVGHNIINYDLPVLKKILNFEHKGKVLDTLILSKLKYTNLLLLDSNNSKLPKNLKGSHSLGAWGYRLGNYKGDYNDWSRLTEDMVEYNRQDVEVTYTLLQKLITKGLPPQQAIDLEQDFATIITRQEHYGWLFDIKKAEKLHVELLELKDIAYKELLEVFKPIKTWIPKDYPKVAYKKNGEKSQTLLSQEANGCHYNDDLQWGYYEDIEFNPGSTQHRVKFIEHYFGKVEWELNENNKPKTGEADLIKLFEDKEFAQPLVKYMNICKLLGQLAEGKNAWLKMVKSDGRLHGYVDTIGAVTRRCTHSYPNLAQVPSSRAFKGKECRELFTVAKGKKLVGCDMSGLELRVFAHYLARFDKGEYANQILEGDIHTFNQKSAGLPTRDNAKTFIYGTLYGAGDAKVGLIVGKDAKEGKRLKNMFKRNVPAYAKLLDGVADAVKKNGTLKALDGNPYFIRSSHSALNTLLQGAGALLCKQWLVLADKELQSKGYRPGIDYEWVGNIHDEVAAEVTEGLEEDIAEIIKSTTTKAGEVFNLRIRLDGEAKIGKTWYDVH